MRILQLLSVLLLTISCHNQEEEKSIDIQGHRGARGLMPENTIPAFKRAIDLGVQTLELDLVVSKDQQLVVSHEPYFSPDFCLDMQGNEIPKDSLINIYNISYDEIKSYDCGSIGNPRFPEQEKMKVSKPLLSDVIDEIEKYTKNKKPLLYNIELKTTKETDTVFHPTPEVFSDLVYELLSEKGIWDRVNIQSFDFRTLKYYNKQYPEVKLALLIENELSWKENIDSLGFTPEIYSCYFKLLESKKVNEIQEAGMLVIPWTVNEAGDIKEVISWKVDGVITDYPNRAIELIK